jgi:sec-independent protein translocase protein TatB
MFPEGRILDFLIVGVVALIVVGPKDLPVLMRKVGRFIAHMRGMAAEFRASFDEMARQSELDELRKEVEALRTGQPVTSAAGLGSAAGASEIFDDIHMGLRESTTLPHPMTSHQAPLQLGSPPIAAEPLAPQAGETPSSRPTAPPTAAERVAT